MADTDITLSKEDAEAVEALVAYQAADLAKAQAEVEDLTKALDEATAPPAEDSTDDIEKLDLPDAVKERLAKADEVVAAQAERIAKMEEATAKGEAASLAKSVPTVGAESDLADLLFVAKRDLDDGTFDALYKTLSDADTKIAASELLKEAGTAAGVAVGHTAIAKAEAAKQEGETIMDVFSRDGDLYAEYQAELAGA